MPAGDPSLQPSEGTVSICQRCGEPASSPEARLCAACAWAERATRASSRPPLPPEPLRPVEAPPLTAVSSSSAPEGLAVRYLGGFSGHPARRVGGGLWRLRAEPDGLLIWWGSQKGSINYRWTLVRSEPWSSLRMLSLAGSGATRANIPAIAIFGVLGLAARREPGTLIGISYEDGDVFFGTGVPVFELGATFRRFVEEVPAAGGKIWFDGVSLSAAPAPSQHAPPGSSDPASVEDALRQLADLHAKQLISDHDFEKKKAEVLARL